MFVCSLRHKYIGHGNISIWQIVDHLYATYANISPSDLQDNNIRLRTPYDPNHLIENLTNQIENAVEYAAAGQTPYTPEQVVTIAYQLVFQTGLFLDDCKTWRSKDPANKTWTNFKLFFVTAHQEWRESQVTSAGAGFQSANAAVYHQDRVDALANLATATTSDRAAVAALTATNSTLTTKLTACQACLVTALQEVVHLTIQSSASPRQYSKNGGSRTRYNPTAKPTNTHYCWTHSYRCDHPGFTCPSPAANHVTKATSRDTKGDATTNKPL